MNRTTPILNPIHHQLNRFSTQTYHQAPKRIAASFKPGPFRGALLTNEPANNHDERPIQHHYSASQLFRSTKTQTNPNTPSPPSSSRTTHSNLHFPHSKLIKHHLEELLYPLSFSDQLACRIVSSKNLIKSQDSLDLLEQQTEGGIGFARLGEHNTKLSFIGRRAMHFALSNFLLHAPRSSTSSADHQLQRKVDHHDKTTTEIIDDALLTKFVLGQYVGHQWELEKIMRWRELGPSASDPSQESTPKPLHGTGLWMARGHVVEAIVGAVMAEHGTRLSIAVFHSLVLPHLSFRLDPALLPAIKAVQAHDQELENPNAGLIDWKTLNLDPFLDRQDHPTTITPSLSRPAPIAAVG